MIGHMRHGSPPRLMALQLILSPNRRESLPTGSAGVRVMLLRGMVQMNMARRLNAYRVLSLALCSLALVGWGGVRGSSRGAGPTESQSGPTLGRAGPATGGRWRSDPAPSQAGVCSRGA